MFKRAYGGYVFIAACCARTDKTTAQAIDTLLSTKGKRKW